MSDLPELTSLLPAVYNLRDADRGNVLRALLGAVQEQAQALENDIGALYDNWFIETCDEWVVPYIGDLLGVRNLLKVSGGAIGQRAFVANALAYRRGKGTATTLEQVAHDITSWPARAVEFFELLAWTQNVNHTRPGAAGNVDLRAGNLLGLIGGPFEGAARTAEVRHAGNARGRYNIGNVGIYLWRLGAYPLDGSPARLRGSGLYRFNQAGADAPLFNAPATELAITQEAGELNLPGPIRLDALHDDLSAFRRGHRAGAARPADSDYYGPARSIEVVRDGEPVSALDVFTADLALWDRPPPGAVGLRSGDLSSFPGAASAAPEIAVTIGDEGPRIARLDSFPADLQAAAAALTAALRSASPSAAFTGARVVPTGTSLLFLPGVRGAAVEVEVTGTDATTAAELRLTGDAETVFALVSEVLEPFPELLASPPRVAVRMSGGAPAVAELASVPATRGEAATVLLDALQSAGGGPEFTGAEVFEWDRRLVVLAGTGAPVAIEPTGDDSTSARLLGLATTVAVDPRRGRLAFSLGGETAGEVGVSHRYGFAGDLGGGPYDRRASMTVPRPGSWVRTVSAADPGADFDGLSAALAAWADPGDGNRADAVIRITDNGVYAGPVSVAVGAGRVLVIEAASGRRPRLRVEDVGGGLGELVVTPGAADAELVLDGLLIEGGIRVEPGALGALGLKHCTLVPGRALADGSPEHPGLPSILAEEPNDGLRVLVERSITGPLVVPAEMRGLEIEDSIVDSPAPSIVPVLVSGSLASFTPPSSVAPTILVTIGDDGPHPCVLPAVPGGVAEARDLLRVALRSGARSPAFTGARVASAGNRLTIIPGVPARVVVENAGADATAAELRLVADDAEAALALVSGPLEPWPDLSASAPALSVTMGDEGPHLAAFASVPASLAQARDELQDAIRNAHSSPAFENSLVTRAGDRLVVIPGEPHTPVSFGAAETDRTTIDELLLGGGGPAIAGVRGPGAPARIVASTILGEVSVRALTLGSESIFTKRVAAERRQSGCVRFSYVTRDSVVSRRHRCRPADDDDPGRVQPLFTSLRYGHPGYGQLAAACPEVIRTGAADEGEMGVWHFLQQGARLKNLGVSLDEYLRFGLEAGVFFVT